LAFFKRGKNKKKAKGVMIGMLIMTLISAGVIALLYFQHTNIVAQYKNELEELQRVFNEETQTVVKVTGLIKAGDPIDSEKVELVRSPNIVTPKNVILDLAEIKNQIAKVDIQPNTQLLESMMVEEIIESSARELELNMLLLPSNLTVNHYMDIRISFPTGEEFVVLSKKKVRELYLKENTTWLWLDEEEILKLSSAVIDAYLNEGAKLYCVTYVDPMFQEGSVENYPENTNVQNLMVNNPNILSEATEQLASNARIELEQRLNSLSVKNINKIKGKLVNEVTKRETQINETIELKKEVIDNTTETSETMFERE